MCIVIMFQSIRTCGAAVLDGAAEAMRRQEELRRAKAASKLPLPPSPPSTSPLSLADGDSPAVRIEVSVDGLVNPTEAAFDTPVGHVGTTTGRGSTAVHLCLQGAHRAESVWKEMASNTNPPTDDMLVGARLHMPAYLVRPHTTDGTGDGEIDASTVFTLVVSVGENASFHYEIPFGDIVSRARDVDSAVIRRISNQVITDIHYAVRAWNNRIVLLRLIRITIDKNVEPTPTQLPPNMDMMS